MRHDRRIVRVVVAELTERPQDRYRVSTRVIRLWLLKVGLMSVPPSPVGAGDTGSEIRHREAMEI